MSQHHHHHEHDHYRPSLGAFFNNFRTYDAPFLQKLAMAAKNTLYKIRTNSSCCGHDGEPGC